jgi:hypothetical protein
MRGTIFVEIDVFFNGFQEASPCAQGWMGRHLKTARAWFGKPVRAGVDGLNRTY